MKEISSEIEIAATPERVRGILSDFAKYPEWHPTIERISGPLEAGRQLEFVGKLEGGRSMKFQPTVLRAEPDRELRWLGKILVRGLFDGEHAFIIEPLGADRVRFRQQERFRGVLVPLLLAMIGKQTVASFETANRALKARAES